MWLEIDSLIAQRVLVPGACTAGTLGWSDPVTCRAILPEHAPRKLCSVAFEADLEDPQTAAIWLRYALCDPRTGRSRPAPPQEIGVEYCRGQWWFVGQRLRRKRLCLARHGPRFAAPEAYGVTFVNPERRPSRNAQRVTPRPDSPEKAAHKPRPATSADNRRSTSQTSAPTAQPATAQPATTQPAAAQTGQPSAACGVQGSAEHGRDISPKQNGGQGLARPVRSCTNPASQAAKNRERSPDARWSWARLRSSFLQSPLRAMRGAAKFAMLRAANLPMLRAVKTALLGNNLERRTASNKASGVRLSLRPRLLAKAAAAVTAARHRINRILICEMWVVSPICSAGSSLLRFAAKLRRWKRQAV